MGLFHQLFKHFFIFIIVETCVISNEKNVFSHMKIETKVFEICHVSSN